MLKPESLIELIDAGSIDSVEEEWLGVVESPDIPVARLADYHVVLKAAAKADLARAVTLAGVGIGSVSARCEALDAISVAGPFLQAVGDSEELRTEVLGLYRTAYDGREGLEALIEEAGLGGGRPVRRALRTLNLCLNLSTGDFLAARDEEGAARIDAIDKDSWTYELTTPDGTLELGAVVLADTYRRAEETEFDVMRLFDHDALVELIWKDPVAIITDICQQEGGRSRRDAIEVILVPSIIPADEWKKWWTKARAAVKRCANLTVDSKAPYYVAYVEVPTDLSGAVEQDFLRSHDPVAKADIVAKYVRECKARGIDIAPEMLVRCHEKLAGKAAEQKDKQAADAVLWMLAARRVSEHAGIDVSDDPIIAFFKDAEDIVEVFAPVQDGVFVELACSCLVDARPDDWREQLALLLPLFPLGSCDQAVRRLVDAGFGPNDFEPMVESIITSPVAHFEALLWLWDGPSEKEMLPKPGAVRVLSCIIRTLEESRRGDGMDTATARKIDVRSRTVLAARKYSRFEASLGDMEPGLGRTLRRQIDRLDNLGRTVGQELSSRLRKKFPPLAKGADLKPWELDDVLYVTSAGLLRKQEEIEHHVNVVMKENSIAIGAAAERGDLSENSEYKFALEERDLLRARLAQMNSEVASARVFSASDVPTDHVGIGSRVMFKRTADGQTYDMSFIGPWEASAEHRRYNYRAPLAQKILGMHVGDVVELDHSGLSGGYEIVGLENALDAGDLLPSTPS